MFQENKKHRQVTIYGMVHQFSVGVTKRLDQSWAPVFRKLIFDKIDERRYADLYSTVKSRPNFPVNIWVGLEIIKGMFDYTDEELLDQFHFNLLIARALGQDNLGDITLSERTIYYNRERLLEYEARTGLNLLEEEFKAITDEALSKLKINTKTQRMDSSFVGSFIKQMSRLELIAKVLQNFYRDLPEAEQIRWKPRLAIYIEDEAEHIAYQLKRVEIEEHLQKLGSFLFELHQAYACDAKISAGKSYQHVSRLLLEQYDITLSSERTIIEVKPAKEISPASLQNPADDTATFRRKDGESYKGDIFNVAETCAPENKVQLLTDISVYPNMAADDVILTERIPEIKVRTGLEEMVVDGNYSGEKSEAACSEEGVNLIPTEVKGRKLQSEAISLADFHFDEYVIIACPEGQTPINQTQKSEKDHHIIHFNKDLCAACERRKNCLVRCGKKCYSLIYNDRQVILSRRRQQLGEKAYRIKCRLRPAVEGTISQFKRHMHHGKLRVRGMGRIRNTIVLMAIGINFGRLWAYSTENKLGLAMLLAMTILFLTYLALKLAQRFKLFPLTSVNPFSDLNIRKNCF
jgi:hypothetical protein